MWPDIPDPSHPWWDPKRHVELPIGIFLAQPVGSTEYTKGLHLRMQLAGEDEVVPGLLSFGACLEMDGSVTWARQQPRCKIRHERAEEITEIALGVARSWFERDPSHCAIYYLDLARKELRDRLREMRQERDLQSHLTKLLDDPGAPRTRNQKNDEGEWEEIQLTAEERAELRELWARNLQSHLTKLAQLHTEQDARILQLRNIERKCRAFLEDRSIQLLPFEACLNQLYAMDDQEAAEDLIHDWFDGRFLEGKFDECDLVLPHLDVSRLSTSLCLTVLAATLPAREKLLHRPDLLSRVREVLVARLEDEPRVNSILLHLRH
jgi:hypothetical protein